MAQPTSNLKIDDLRSRIRLDPKSRVFYPLAEELRKIGQVAESERVLRVGLEHHPTYLSAWVSLGRVLRDQHKDAEAIEALKKALQLDPGNVVAARLLGDAYLTTGDKIEAIKKYKLLLALMPGDQDVEAIVEGLERELNPIVLATVEENEPGPASDSSEMRTPAHAAPAAESPAAAVDESPFAEAESFAPAAGVTPFAPADHPMDETRPQARPQPPDESPWDDVAASPSPAAPPASEQPLGEVQAPPVSSWHQAEPVAPESTGDDEPMLAVHSDSPFEDPSGYSSDALNVEQPSGMHIEEAPETSSDASIWGEPSSRKTAPDEASPWSDQAESSSQASPAWGDDQNSTPDASNVFASSSDEPEQREDVTNTLTMADLYVRQGQTQQAAEIYDRILDRDPGNEEVRSKRSALTAGTTATPRPQNVGDQRAEKLGRWLTKVGRKEDGGV